MHITTKIEGEKELLRNIKLLEKKSNETLKEVLLKSVITVEGEAKNITPVDTGRLRASITHEVKTLGKKHAGRVGTNVKYAPYVEFGTSRMGAQPFLFPALKDSRPAILRFFKRAIEKLKL